MERLGIDIGGSGIKGALVDLGRGKLAGSRYRIPTPQPSLPADVAAVVAEIVDLFGVAGPIGCTVPSVVRAGMVETAANIDPSWVGTDGVALLEGATGRTVTLLNDADAAGIAEMRYGAGRGAGGVVILLTFGTGIGSAVFVDGRLVPNTELGHLEFKGMPAEHYAAGRLHEAEGGDGGLTYQEWGARVDEYLHHVDRLFSPDLYIVGGGISKQFDRFSGYLHVRTPVVPAKLRNRAGIVGAALASRTAEKARSRAKKKKKRKSRKR